MSSQMSSKWVALLGLLAVAGYKNRDKIADMLGAQNRAPGSVAGANSQPAAHGGVLGNLGGLLGGASAGSVLSGGLRDLVDRFRGSGHAEAADSWVRKGPNQPLGTDDLEKAIGPDALNTLSQ